MQLKIDSKNIQSDFLPSPFSDHLPRHYLCPWTDTEIQIDGALTDPAWETTVWSEPFVDIEGDRKPLPKYPTKMKMLWNQNYLYIAAELTEPDLWATITKHDEVIFRDNDFEVFIDPDGDNFDYPELELNALNTTWDLLLPRPYKDGGQANNAFDIKGLKTAVKLNGTLNNPIDRDKSWTVEIAWPWSAFKQLTKVSLPPREQDLWRMNFSRVEWKLTVENNIYKKMPNLPESNWIWSPQGVIDMHRPEHWGYVEFTKKPISERAIHLDPYSRAKLFLHRVYYAQKKYYSQFHHFATSLGQLNIVLPAHANFFLSRFEASESQFRVEISCYHLHSWKHIQIDQQSHIVLAD